MFSYSKEDTTEEEVEATKAVIEKEIERLREKEREMERKEEQRSSGLENVETEKKQEPDDHEKGEDQEKAHDNDNGNGRKELQNEDKNDTNEEGQDKQTEPIIKPGSLLELVNGDGGASVNRSDDDSFYETIERPQTPIEELIEESNHQDVKIIQPQQKKHPAPPGDPAPTANVVQLKKDEPKPPKPLNMRRMKAKDPRWPSRHENDGKAKYNTRDSAGYGHTPPNPKWPGGAKVAINFILNYEEGGETCPLHGDPHSETYLTDMIGLEKSVAQDLLGTRHVNMESLYDYGSRAGFWRLYRMFTTKHVPCTVFAVGMALERNQQACKAMKDAGWEIASHGYRSLDYRGVDDLTQLEHIMRTVKVHEELIGRRPVGFFQGKPNESTRRLVCEAGGFLYDSDSYADDLPYWSLDTDQPHLIIPYSLTENDMRFVSPNGFHTGKEFYEYLKETLDALLEEGKEGRSKLMTIGLHCRIIGRPGRSTGLSKFMDYVKKLESELWVCTREELAKHWYDTHYPVGQGSGYQVPI